MTTLGTNVDGAVRRLHADYDGQGNPYLLTSYSASSGGSVVNQVQRAFNGLGQLTAEYQAHGAAVNTSTTPKVQYAYAEMGGGANQSRPTTLTYPNGRALTYDYGTASGLNDSISRLSALKDGSTTLEGYSFLGLATVVKRSHPEPGIDLTYVKLSGESNGDGGDQYTGLDRFGRVADQRWVVASSGVAVDRFGYTYDRDGNAVTKTNGVNGAFSEAYTYDGLNQLASFARGSHTQAWGYDSQGNWDSVTTDGTAQTRGHNQQNEITSISSATTPTYDASGNLTTDETGRQFVYDAWNRLVKVKDSGGTVLETLGYDVFNQRVSVTTSTATTDLYYSSDSQVLEVRVGGVAAKQYVWSPVGVDVLVERDRDTDANGTLDERLYVLQDAGDNVTALVNTSGAVVERFVYDPYGAATVLDASWGARSGSAYDWTVLWQGQHWDSVSGLYLMRDGDYSPTLGRMVTTGTLEYWMDRSHARNVVTEMMVFTAGYVNLNGYVDGSLNRATGPSGLSTLDGKRTTCLQNSGDSEKYNPFKPSAEEMAREQKQKQIDDIIIKLIPIAIDVPPEIEIREMGPNVKGFLRIPWIRKHLFRELNGLAGPIIKQKFIDAIKKGLVGPHGRAGIKKLDRAVDGFTHELKIIGGGHHRLLGRIENGVLIFSRFVPGGL